MFVGVLLRAVIGFTATFTFPIAQVRPVDGPVIADFKAPPCEWCAGRRGVIFDSVPGEEVKSIVSGHVFFTGAVAGVRYLTVITGDGWKVTYGRLDPSADFKWVRGDWVRAGDPVATAGDDLFLSLRRGKTPYDPARMFRRRAVLVPPGPAGKQD